ncbi:hypothetical protein BH09SUM1_BH09SUM1_21750 [soil metagenome]
MRRRILPPLFFLLLAFLQINVIPRGANFQEKWFLYGTDTFAHDAIVHLWMQQFLARSPTTISLWAPGLQGGLPALGSFLWTPFAPNVWPLGFMSYPIAQRLGWMMALWIAGCGAWIAARAQRLPVLAAVLSGVVWMLCGHVVTLIHAGHFQKVMALGWLPWMTAGAIYTCLWRSNAARARGVALTALGLGMMFLSGHPQIAYTGLAICCGIFLFSLVVRKRGRLAGGCFLAVGVAVGIVFGGVQLLPGVEMSSFSNRAGGIDYDEAVQTSYPPGEIPELFIPRMKGSSVAGDHYHGDWGERIVSDFIGRLAVILALASLFAARRKPIILFWMLIVGMSLWVAVGRYTPLYRILFLHLPGFSSFRSPGTFMAATSLGLAFLAGHGFAWSSGFIKRITLRRIAFAAAVMICCGELFAANRFFLIAFPWEKYGAEFLAPTDLDVWLSEPARQFGAYDSASPYALRPLLFGRRSLKGYHPISLGVKIQRDEDLRRQPEAWRREWGVNIELAFPDDKEWPADRVIETFASAGRKAIDLRNDTGLLVTKSGELPDADFRRIRVGANEERIEISGTTGEVRVNEAATPGMRRFLNNEELPAVAEPVLFTTWNLTAGKNILEFRYEPFAYRLGLFMTAMGGFAAMLFWRFSGRRFLK